MNFFNVKRIKIDENTDRMMLLNELSRNPLEGSLRGEVEKVNGKKFIIFVQLRFMKDS